MSIASPDRVLAPVPDRSPTLAPSCLVLSVLELMCMLCKRIRSYPALLMIFFHDKALHVGGQSHAPQHAPTSSPPAEDPDLSNLLARVGSPVPSMATGISSELGAGGRGEPKKDFEFLLFSYLLRFVHRESPIVAFSIRSMTLIWLRRFEYRARWR